MRVFLDTALLVLALANTLIDPVDAMPTHAPKRHLLKRATNGFHKTALRHSAGLAHDLRIALRGLGVASPVRVSVTNGSSAAYCVSVPNASKPKSNTNTTTASSGRSSPTSTTKGPSSVTSTSTPSSTAQSDWRLAESYVRLNFYFCVPPARNFFFSLVPDVEDWVCDLVPQSGNTFFSGWNFFTGGDPTNGIVQYVDQGTAVRVVPAFVTSAHVS